MAVFHLANGIFGTCIDWGITIGPHSQRVFVGVSFLAFLVLCCLRPVHASNRRILLKGVAQWIEGTSSSSGAGWPG